MVETGEVKLVVRLFGSLNVRVNGSPLPHVHSHRQNCLLLALLVLRRGQEVERSFLANTLWPDSDKSLENLRSVLNDLKTALSTEQWRLKANRHTLQLELSGTDVDLVAFDAVTQKDDVSSLQRVVKLYQGPLLEEFQKEWIIPERTAREDIYLEALQKLAKQSLDNGYASDSVSYLRKVIGVNPLIENAQRSLLQSLFVAGDFGAMVQTYRDLRLYLHRELNTAPDTETTKLYNQLRAEANRRSIASSVGTRWEKHSPPPFRVPTPLGRLVGRQHEIEQSVLLLRKSRLLTIKGVGGVGKTRLAIAVAEDTRAEYPDGVFFVDLAPISNSALLPQVMASVLELREETETLLLDSLQNHLRYRSVLLLIDNCEQLLDGCVSLVSILLQTCPHLRVLATSRQALLMNGEIVQTLSGLSMPSTLWRRQMIDKEIVAQLSSNYAAVELFEERARSVQPGFHLTEANAMDIARICQQLDGLPLAIELAAAWVRTVTVSQIAAHLSLLLTIDDPTRPPRQHTIEATLDWSYALLKKQEQVLFRRLSVFSGGCSLEAAQAICYIKESEGTVRKKGDASASLPIVPRPLPEFVTLLTSLVDKSLVVFSEDESGNGRYHMLEMIEHYAQNHLTEAEEVELLTERHRNYFLTLAEIAAAELQKPEQAVWLRQLEVENANLRATFEMCLASDNSAEVGLRLAKATWRYYWLHGYLSEGRAYLDRALARAGAAERTTLRAEVLYGAGVLAYIHGEQEASKAYYEASLAIYQELKDKRGIALSLDGLGDIARDLGKYAEASTLYEDSLTILRELRDKQSIGKVLRGLGMISSEQGDYATARIRLKESVAILRTTGDQHAIAYSLLHLGIVAEYESDYPLASSLYKQSLAIFETLSNTNEIAWAQHGLGYVAYRQADFDTAHSMLKQAMVTFRDNGNLWGVARSLERYGVIALAQHQMERAGKLYAAAASLRDVLGFPVLVFEREEYEGNLTAIREKLTDRVFQENWAMGESMTLEQAIVYALDEMSI